MAEGQRNLGPKESPGLAVKAPSEEVNHQRRNGGAHESLQHDVHTHVGRPLFDGEKHTSHGRSEGRRDTCGRASGHEVALLPVDADGPEQRSGEGVGCQGAHDGPTVDHRAFLAAGQPSSDAEDDAHALGDQRERPKHARHIDAIQERLDLRNAAARSQRLHEANESTCHGRTSKAEGQEHQVGYNDPCAALNRLAQQEPPQLCQTHQGHIDRRSH
mmetsp:Transcript_41155/g.66496  ORF Transcript_41155/g.66496 Transcript_41155/m.66496 type:complete len:216 (+) Transcript_41155:265-912(+)